MNTLQITNILGDISLKVKVSSSVTDPVCHLLVAPKSTTRRAKITAVMSAPRAYLAIDIGGSKTLLAVFSTTGKLLKKIKFVTPKNYRIFIKELSKCLQEELSDWQFALACCGAPGIVDRQRGLGLVFGNLPWKRISLKADLERLLDVGVLVENDANLAGLGEALLVHKRYRKVLYLTIGTGIGDGIIIDGKIDLNFADSEAGHMLVEHDGRVAKWEDFASGKAIKKRYGRLASEIEDPQIWNEYAKAVATGLNELLAVIKPDIVIIGGGVGEHFDRFDKALGRELTTHPHKMVPIPEIVKAKRPGEAVIYGCYEYIKQNI